MVSIVIFVGAVDRGSAKIWTATTLRHLPSHAANRHRVLPQLEKIPAPLIVPIAKFRIY
jgi:hypothetical protein